MEYLPSVLAITYAHDNCEIFVIPNLSPGIVSYTYSYTVPQIVSNNLIDKIFYFVQKWFVFSVKVFMIHNDGWNKSNLTAEFVEFEIFVTHRCVGNQQRREIICFAVVHLQQSNNCRQNDYWLLHPSARSQQNYGCKESSISIFLIFFSFYCAWVGSLSRYS